MAAPNQVSSTNAFPWRFVTPLYMGSVLNPINSSLIATALVPIAAAVFGSTVGVAAARERVATLESIVADIGVDRGLLISEKGFQPGGA